MSEQEAGLLGHYAEVSDAEAFRALVERHAGMVFAACRRVLGNRADAEDATQEAFLKLAREAGGLRAPIAPWLHRVAVNVSLTMAQKDRSRRKREANVARNGASASSQKASDPAADASWVEIKRHVDAALTELPANLRSPIVLHYLEGRTQGQAAEELSLTQSAVSKRLKRGVRELRRRLKRAGVAAFTATSVL